MRITPPSILLALACLPCLAQAPLWNEGSTPGQWSVRAGAMAFTTPAIPGSSRDRFLVLPVFSADYDGRVFLGSSLVSVGAGAGLRLVRTDQMSWDLGLGVGEKRPEARADELAGLGNRSADAFLGTGLRVHRGGWHAAMKVAAGLVRGSGARATLDLGTGSRIAPRTLAGLGVSAVWGTAQNLAWDFGISPEQAALRHQLLGSGDPRLKAGEDRAFSPSGGLRELNATAHLVFVLSGQWQAFAVARGTSLQGDARQSPLVRRPQNLSGGLGASLRF